MTDPTPASDADMVHQIVERGDPAEILRVGLNASLKAGDGEFCSCPDPILEGGRLVCGRCLLSNKAQRDARAKLAAEPHPLRWTPLDKQKHEERIAKKGPEWDRMALCRLCGGWRDDPRHEGQGDELWGFA